MTKPTKIDRIDPYEQKIRPIEGMNPKDIEVDSIGISAPIKENKSSIDLVNQTISIQETSKWDIKKADKANAKKREFLSKIVDEKALSKLSEETEDEMVARLLSNQKRNNNIMRTRNGGKLPNIGKGMAKAPKWEQDDEKKIKIMQKIKEHIELDEISQDLAKSYFNKANVSWWETQTKRNKNREDMSHNLRMPHAKSAIVAKNIFNKHGKIDNDLEFTQDKRKKGMGMAFKRFVKESLDESNEILKNITKKYINNEDKNYHNENAIMLAKHFGDDDDKAEANYISNHYKKNGADERVIKFQSKMNKKYFHHLQPHYDYLVNEETLIEGKYDTNSKEYKLGVQHGIEAFHNGIPSAPVKNKKAMDTIKTFEPWSKETMNYLEGHNHGWHSANLATPISKQIGIGSGNRGKFNNKKVGTTNEEALDEISKDLTAKYLKRAIGTRIKHASDSGERYGEYMEKLANGERFIDDYDDPEENNSDRKRRKGIDLAIKKLQKEEYLNELSPELLNRYSDKASKDIMWNDDVSRNNQNNNKIRKDAINTIKKRRKGLGLYFDKLNKE